MQIGSAVHQLFLQKDDFTLIEGLNKPSAKLGQVVEKAKHYRNNGHSVVDSIHNAAHDVGYYVNCLTEKRIHDVIEKGFSYY